MAKKRDRGDFDTGGSSLDGLRALLEKGAPTLDDLGQLIENIDKLLAEPAQLPRVGPPPSFYRIGAGAPSATQWRAAFEGLRINVLSGEPFLLADPEVKSRWWLVAAAVIEARPESE